MGEGVFFFFQEEDGIRDYDVTGVQTCALPIWYFNPPTLWYAAWEFPIIKYQEKIFGNKILFDELMHFNVAWDEGTETTRSKVNTFLTLREQDRAAGRPWKTKKILSECMIILRNFNHIKDK